MIFCSDCIEAAAGDDPGSLWCTRNARPVPGIACNYYRGFEMAKTPKPTHPTQQLIDSLVDGDINGMGYHLMLERCDLSTLLAARAQIPASDTARYDMINNRIRQLDVGAAQPEAERSPIDAELIDAIEGDSLPSVTEILADTEDDSSSPPMQANPEQAAQIQVGELIGMIKAFDFVKKLTTVGTLKVLAQLKETKQYKGLSLIGPDEKLTTVGTWADFCGAIGQSVNKVDEDILNLSTFGESFMEASNRLGLGYREMRKLRKLPEDERAVVLENVEIAVSDKNAIVSLIDDLAAKHAKEKADLATQLEKTAGERDAARRGRDKLLEENAALKEAEELRALKPPAPDQEADRLRGELAALARQNGANIATEMRRGIIDLLKAGEATGVDHRPFLAGLLIEIERQVNVLRGDFHLPSTLDDDPTPVWMRPDFDPLAAAHGQIQG